MKISRFGPKFRALGLGFLLSLLLFGLSLGFASLHRQGDGDVQLGLRIAQFALSIGLSLGFAVWSAVGARSNDGVAFIPCAVPAAFAFILLYAFSVHQFCYREPGVMYHVLGVTAPYDLVGQFWIALPLLIWVALTGVVGIGLKRIFYRRVPDPGEHEQSSDYDESFGIVVGFLIVTVVAGMGAFALYVQYTSLPSQRVAKSGRTLENPSASFAQRQAAVFQLRRIRSEASTATLNRTANLQPPAVKLTAACILASRNDFSYLPYVEEHLLKETALSNLKPGFFLREVSDPLALPTLIKLLEKAPDPEVRQAAAYALRNIGSETALDPLIKGLDDEDRDVRWHLVMALAKIVGHSGGEKSQFPDRDTFAAEEQSYLDHWKAWARSRVQGQGQAIEERREAP